MKSALLSVAAVVCLASCVHGGLNVTTGPIQLYDGSALPAESVAIIQNDPNMFLVSVDSQSMRRWTATHDVLRVQVLPGRHVVVAQPSARGGFVSMQAVRIEFVAQAGHRYVASRQIGGGTASTTWTPVFTDVTTGKTIGP